MLEAKGLGLPVVVSDACAGREEVEDGVTGLWFASADSDDLARALVALRDDARVSAMSHASYAAYWREPPTIERHVELLTAVYDEALARVKVATLTPNRASTPKKWAEKTASL